MTRVANVNSDSLLDAIQLGCRTMASVFNADDNDTPYFGSEVRPNPALSFSPRYSDAHVPGRHLNGLLNAEDAAGIRIDEDAVSKHTRTTFFSYRGPVALPLNREEVGGGLINFNPHNLREGFHALYALTKFRKSQKAYELACQSIDAIFQHWDAQKGWDYDYLEGTPGLNVERNTFIVGIARCIGPLVKFYKATGYGPALELATILKEKTINEFFKKDGSYDRDSFGAHTHSTTCTMSSLAQLADQTSDSHLMNRVKAFYDNGLWEIRDELGWVIENSGEEADPDRGEVNNTGDIVETALILGRWGYTEYYDDAERIVRSHILPSQLRDVSFIIEPDNPTGDDGKRDVASRHLGAFGFPAPYGHHPLDYHRVSFNMDIVGGAVGTLSEVCRDASAFDGGTHKVNLLFDHETPYVEVRSPYEDSTLRVRVKRPGPLLVRIPSWTDAGTLQISGTDSKPVLTNGNLLFAEPPVNRFIEISLQIPEREIALKHRTRDIRVRLRGDKVTAMESFGADLTFFPDM